MERTVAMVKITWCSLSDPHMTYFAVCDHVSGWELAYLLKTWCKQVGEVRAWDLSGNPISLNKGYAEFTSQREISYGL